MYQPCTSTAVNHGEQRSPRVLQNLSLSRPNTRLAGAPSSLITRRSQVQILPPPFDEMPGNIGFPGISHFRPRCRLPSASTGSRDLESLNCEFATLIW